MARQEKGGFRPPPLGKILWKCTECGHANDVTDANLRGTCMECGELLDDPNATLCKECETERLEKMAIALEKASQDIKSLKS